MRNARCSRFSIINLVIFKDQGYDNIVGVDCIKNSGNSIFILLSDLIHHIASGDEVIFNDNKITYDIDDAGGFILRTVEKSLCSRYLDSLLIPKRYVTKDDFLNKINSLTSFYTDNKIFNEYHYFSLIDFKTSGFCNSNVTDEFLQDLTFFEHVHYRLLDSVVLIRRKQYHDAMLALFCLMDFVNQHIFSSNSSSFSNYSQMHPVQGSLNKQFGNRFDFYYLYFMKCHYDCLMESFKDKLNVLNLIDTYSSFFYRQLYKIRNNIVHSDFIGIPRTFDKLLKKSEYEVYTGLDSKPDDFFDDLVTISGACESIHLSYERDDLYTLRINYAMIPFLKMIISNIVFVINDLKHSHEFR